jgi:serine phosphatase RsbU (regulator of sigma subunit)
LSEVYRKQLQYPQAKEVLIEAEKEFRRLLDTFGLATAYSQLAESHFDVGDLSKSRDYALKAIDLAEPRLYFDVIKHAYNTLYLIESRKGNLERALEYLEKYSKVLDGEIKENKMLRESRKRLNIERIKRSITQSKLSEVELAKANMELEMQLNEIKFSQQRQLVLYVSIFAVLISAILLILFFMFKAKKKNNLLLEDRNRQLENVNMLLNKQNETIIEQSERIFDSINYALTIQNAMLPDASVVNKIFEQNFIFFKPKDIVSGDFYWFREVNGYKYAAVVDCTGHGVPGAFMSMIGSTLLNEIVINDKISNPATILNELDMRLKFYMQNREHSTVNDGMDIALIQQDKDGKIRFSGAGRPLYYTFNGEFHEIKGDPFSIGGKRSDDREFTTIELENIQNATIYLTSDGFADQNNKENKKISTKKLKNLLYLVSVKSLAEQLEIINEEFISHMGDEKQRDDVTIIGVKV